MYGRHPLARKIVRGTSPLPVTAEIVSPGG